MAKDRNANKPANDPNTPDVGDDGTIEKTPMDKPPVTN